MTRAILASSILFGIGHPDIIGAAAFGIAMSILYLRTRTLMVPIVCHGLYNLLVWLIEAGYCIWLGPDYEYSLEDFQDEWGIGLACAVIVIIWTQVYIAGGKSRKIWSLPEI